MATEFQSICDDLSHATLTAEDARALVQPAWFLAQQAVQDFSVLSLLPPSVKAQLTLTIDALELNLATLADKAPGTPVDFFQFKDICHLAQITWTITEPLGSNAIVRAREQLAQASERIKTRMARADRGGIGAGTVLLWTSAIGFGLYMVRRLRRKQAET